MKLGIVGAGAIAGAHLRAAQSLNGLCEFVAVAGRSQEKKEKLCQRFGIPKLCRTTNELFEDPEVEGVVLATPNRSHYPLSQQAAESGKHILVEKPMACSLTDGEQMVEFCRQKGIVLMVAQCERYRPSNLSIREVIAKGELGTVRSARIEVMQNIRSFVPPGHWIYQKSQSGGGVVINVAIHRLDLMRYLFGEPESVDARCFFTDPSFGEGIEDLALATIRFQNGLIASLHSCWHATRLAYSENTMLFGDLGVIHCIPETAEQFGAPKISHYNPKQDEHKGWKGQFGGFQSLDTSLFESPSTDPFANQLAHFVECCKTGREPITSGADNLNTIRLIDTIYRSSEEKKEIIVNDPIHMDQNQGKLERNTIGTHSR